MSTRLDSIPPGEDRRFEPARLRKRPRNALGARITRSWRTNGYPALQSATASPHTGVPLPIAARSAVADSTDAFIHDVITRRDYSVFQ